MRFKLLKSLMFFLPLALMSVWGCSALKESHTSWPVKEYEKVIAGRLDADYVGTDTCVAKCHTHDSLTRDFRRSVHGAQQAGSTGQPLVNCESCHGPGSLAVENIKNETCDFSTFIPLETIPAGAQSLICLKCHSSFSLSKLSGWSNSNHAVADVSCFDCHQLHRGPDQKVKHDEIANLCFECHMDKKALFSLPSHHPVQEGKMTCTDCHDAHEGNLANKKVVTIRDLCTRCHADKRGPFVVEHGTNLTDDCTTCHNPHGSIHSAMTTLPEPMMCLQCHHGHNTPRHPGLTGAGTAARTALFGRCTLCHARHHGTDSPGFRKDGRFFR